MGLPGGTVVKNPPANVGGARDTGSIPGLGRSPGIGNGMSLYFLHMFKIFHKNFVSRQSLHMNS